MSMHEIDLARLDPNPLVVFEALLASATSDGPPRGCTCRSRRRAMRSARYAGRVSPGNVVCQVGISMPGDARRNSGPFGVGRPEPR